MGWEEKQTFFRETLKMLAWLPFLFKVILSACLLHLLLHGYVYKRHWVNQNRSCAASNNNTCAMRLGSRSTVCLKVTVLEVKSPSESTLLQRFLLIIFLNFCPGVDNNPRNMMLPKLLIIILYVLGIMIFMGLRLWILLLLKIGGI